MKKLYMLMFILVSSLFANTANTNANATEDTLNVQPTQEVRFHNGFGAIFAKPMLNDKSVQEKLILQGQFNVDDKNNVEIVFDKVQYEGKVYSLNSAFSKKSRLKDKKAVLDKNKNFIVAGGDRNELLSLINMELAEDKNKDTSSENSSSNSKYSSGSYGGNSGSGTSFVPTTLGTTSTGTSSNSSDSNDATLIVDCPAPTFTDGIATYYEQLGTVCAKKTSNSAYAKYDSRSCKNKIDYVNNTIQLGYEMFVTSPDGGDYLVQNCQYQEAQELLSEVGSCTATAIFEDNTAIISKQFYYMHENQRNNVGNCVQTDIIVPLQNDINACSNDRHDFLENKSYAQTQYFYIYNNVKRTIGQCVDAPNLIYNHYLDDTTCKYDIIDGRVFYKQRVAYDDLIGVKKFATDCATTSSGGLEMYEEFSGYSFKDSSRQAIATISTYFFIPGTTTKVYVDKDIETNRAYPYIYERCNLVNDDENLITTLYERISFDDTDRGVEVEVSPCQEKQVVAYQKLTTTDTPMQTLSNQLVEPSGSNYKILGTSNILTGQPNWTRNTPTWTSPLISSGTSNGVCSSIGTPRSCTDIYRFTIPTANLSKKIGNTIINYHYTAATGFSSAISCINTESTLTMINVNIINNSCQRENCGDMDCYHRTYNVQYSLKTGYADNQIINVIQSQQQYLRGDGTTYTEPGSGTIRYVAQ